MSNAIQTPSREQWLAERRKGIGASEAAAVVGLSPWQTPLELYLEKTGAMPDREPTDAMRRGIRLERFVAEEYQHETGVMLDKPPSILLHPDWPTMRASLDYWVPGEKVVQIKTDSGWKAGGWGEPGTGEVPEHYALQVQQEMACSELPIAEIALLRVASWTFDIYVVERNQGVIDSLLEAERDFWRRVEEKDPPLPDFDHPTTSQILAMLEPVAGSEVVLDEEVAHLVAQYESLGKASRDAEAARKVIKGRLLHAVGDAEFAHLPDGRVIRRRRQPAKDISYTRKAFTDFRILKSKGKS